MSGARAKSDESGPASPSPEGALADDTGRPVSIRASISISACERVTTSEEDEGSASLNGPIVTTSPALNAGSVTSAASSRDGCPTSSSYDCGVGVDSKPTWMRSSTQEPFCERVVASVNASVDSVVALDGRVEGVVTWLGVVGASVSGVVVSRGVVGAAVGSGVVGGVTVGVVMTTASVVMGTSVVERAVVVGVEVVYVYASKSFIVRGADVGSVNFRRTQDNRENEGGKIK